MTPPVAPLPAVPRLWPESTIVCLAGGPSLTPADVDACRDRGVRVIAIKEAIRLAPWCDLLYACDAKWWNHYGPTLTFQGPRYSLEPQQYAVKLRETGPTGLELDPTGLRTGRNSGYQAINLAVHLGARQIILLGYDLQPDGRQDHWFGQHPWKLRPCYGWEPLFETLVAPLAAAGVSVLNASRRTLLTCWPHMSIDEALAYVPVPVTR